jgi:hypothetical protein
MSITVIFSKPDGTVNQTEVHDFGSDPAARNNNIDRLTEWAQATYLNEDGSQPGPNAARSRCAKGFVKGVRDALRKFELDADKAALPPPEDIAV